MFAFNEYAEYLDCESLFRVPEEDPSGKSVILEHYDFNRIKVR